MKKNTFLIVTFILFIFFISNSLALSSDIKSSYLGLQTVTIKLEGKIVEPISVDQIEFKRRNVVVPFEFDVMKIYQDYYIWFVTPKIENETNYTLIIRDVYVEEFGQNKKTSLYQNFSVSNNITDYFVTPGFVFTKENYTLVINSNRNSNMNINIDFPTKKTLELLPGRNEFFFETKDIENSIFKEIKIGIYEIPLYLIKEGELVNVKNNTWSINPSNIEFDKEIGSNELEYQFKVLNIGGNIIQDIELDYNSDYIIISPKTKIDIYPGEEVIYNVSLKRERNISQIIRIYSEKNNLSREINIEINFSEFFNKINDTLFNQTLQNNSDSYYCLEIGGKTCVQDQKCEGQTLKTKNNVSCCIGKCSLIKTPEKDNSWIGYLIIALAILAIVLVFIKYKKVKPEKTILEKAIEENRSIKKSMP